MRFITATSDLTYTARRNLLVGAGISLTTVLSDKVGTHLMTEKQQQSSISARSALLPNKADLSCVSNWIARLSLPSGLELVARLQWVRVFFKVKHFNTTFSHSV